MTSLVEMRVSQLVVNPMLTLYIEFYNKMSTTIEITKLKVLIFNHFTIHQVCLADLKKIEF